MSVSSYIVYLIYKHNVDKNNVIFRFFKRIRNQRIKSKIIKSLNQYKLKNN